MIRNPTTKLLMAEYSVRFETIPVEELLVLSLKFQTWAWERDTFWREEKERFSGREGEIFYMTREEEREITEYSLIYGA